MKGRLAPLALTAVAVVCCAGLPLVLAAGTGALLWIIGAGVPLVLVVLAVGVLIERRRRSSRTQPVVREAERTT